MAKMFQIMCQAKNWHGLRRNNSPQNGLIMLIFESHMSKGVISQPVKEFFKIINFGWIISFFKTFQILYQSSYDNKQWFVAIPVGDQYQQVNVTHDPNQMHKRSFWYRISNLLAWKSIFPTSSSSTRDASISRSSSSRIVGGELIKD